MRLRSTFLALALISTLPSMAAPWQDESLRIKVNLPGTWKFITPKMADQRMKSSRDSADIVFYGELKKRTETGNFFVFEQRPKSKVRADLQTGYLGKPLGGTLAERDIKNLCPLWAANRDENERPFLDCQPRQLGIAWTALLTYEPEPGVHEYQIKYFRPDGTLILFTVRGTRAQAEAIFRNTKFY
jgi:hypothetical protein